MNEGSNFKSGSPHPHPPLMPSWNGLEGYYVIRYLKLFQSTNHFLIFTCLFLVCYIFVWIGHWGHEFLLNSSSEIITVIFTVANSLYVIRVIWGIIFLRSLYSDETTSQLLLKGHENDFQLQQMMNRFFIMNMLILLSLRFGECVCYYQEITIWIFYFPMTIFHDFINAFALTISLFLIISQQGQLQLLLSQLRFNLSSIFYDGKSFVSHEFLLQSPYPSPFHSHHTSQSLFLLSTPSSSLPSPSVQVNPVLDSQFHRQISKVDSGDIEINENESHHAHSSSNSLSEYDIFLLFTQHYLHLHSSFHYLTVTYGKYLLFLIASMLCTILHLILYIYAYRGGSSLSSIIESICSFYVIVVLMFNLAKVNALGRHVQTLMTRKCMHLLTTLQSNPFLTTAPQLSPTNSRISSDKGAVPPNPPHTNPHVSSPATDRMIFYHQINGFISSLQILKLTFGFTRYFALDYNGLNALLFSLVLSMIPRLLTNHMHQ